jgi:hypothetical protein
VGRLTIVLLCSLACGTARAESASQLGSRFTHFFRWNGRIPENVRVTLDLYERGDLFGAAATADAAVRSAPPDPFHDELLLVRSLALAERGWSREAEDGFRAILESDEPSPYYPLALLGLIESSHREDRIDAVVEAYTRYWEKPWQDGDRRSLKIRNLLDAYGELRAPSPRLSEREAVLVARPTELARELEFGKERVSERLLYLSGVALFRAGEYTRSIEALDRIAVVSLYFPYGLYTAAQDHYALGDVAASEARIALLLRYPALTDEEQALADRAGLFLVQALFDAGRSEAALAAARGVSGDGRFALAARLLRAEIVLSNGQPSLALAFYGDLSGKRLGARLDAERALGLGEAYVKLGDFASAAASLRSASEGIARTIAGLDPGESERLAELRSLVEDQVQAAGVLATARRRRIADGIRRVMAFEGPLNIGKVFRVLFKSHRNTIIGWPVYDVRLLAESRPPRATAASRRPDWLGYLASRQRTTVEDALRLRTELAAETDDDAIGRAVAIDALLGLVEGRFPIADGPRKDAEATLRLLGHDPVAPPSRVRDELLVDLARQPRQVSAGTDVIAAARQVAIRHLDDVVTSGLRRVVAREGEDLRRLEFELQARLSQAMLHENDAVRRTGTP